MGGGYSPGGNALKKAHEGRIATRCEHEVWRFWNNVMDGVAPMTPMEYEPLDDYTVDPEQEDVALQREAREWIAEGRKTLVGRQWEILLRRFAGEETFNQIGRTVGLSQERIRQIYMRGELRMRVTSRTRVDAARSLIKAES